MLRFQVDSGVFYFGIDEEIDHWKITDFSVGLHIEVPNNRIVVVCKVFGEII